MLKTCSKIAKSIFPAGTSFAGRAFSDRPVPIPLSASLSKELREGGGAKGLGVSAAGEDCGLPLAAMKDTPATASEAIINLIERFL